MTDSFVTWASGECVVRNLLYGMVLRRFWAFVGRPIRGVGAETADPCVEACELVINSCPGRGPGAADGEKPAITNTEMSGATRCIAQKQGLTFI